MHFGSILDPLGVHFGSVLCLSGRIECKFASDRPQVGPKSARKQIKHICRIIFVSRQSATHRDSPQITSGQLQTLPIYQSIGLVLLYIYIYFCFFFRHFFFCSDDFCELWQALVGNLLLRAMENVRLQERKIKRSQKKRYYKEINGSND